MRFWLRPSGSSAWIRNRQERMEAERAAWRARQEEFIEREDRLRELKAADSPNQADVDQAVDAGLQAHRAENDAAERFRAAESRYLVSLAHEFSVHNPGRHYRDEPAAGWEKLERIDDHAMTEEFAQKIRSAIRAERRARVEERTMWLTPISALGGIVIGVAAVVSSAIVAILS